MSAGNPAVDFGGAAQRHVEQLARFSAEQGAEIVRLRSETKRRVAFLAAAARDARLRDGTLKVLFFLTADLDWHEFRLVKALSLAVKLGRKNRYRTANAIQVLTRLGYLERGPSECCGAKTWNSYRLSRVPTVPESGTAPSE